MLNFVLPILKNPLTRMIGSKVIDGINHKMEKDKIIRAKEIEAVKTVSVEQVRQQEHSIKDEILTLLISAIFVFTFLPFSQPYMTKGFEILKSLGIRSRGVNIISCPSCARQAFPVIDTVKALEKKLSHIKEPITLSIIGCVVNGPGEAAQTEIGLTGGGQDKNLLYLSGIPHSKVASTEILDKVVELVEKKVKEKTV